MTTLSLLREKAHSINTRIADELNNRDDYQRRIDRLTTIIAALHEELDEVQQAINLLEDNGFDAA